MIIGIGTDILNIKHIQTLMDCRTTDPFFKKTYTINELNLIEGRPDPVYSYATRFAGKEAVYKALNECGNAISLNEIEILEDKNGKPYVVLYEKAKESAEKQGITSILVSLSYDQEYAVAYSICQNE